MKKENISLKDLSADFGYFHVKIDRPYLKKLLIRASNGENPHYCKELMDQLSMSFTKNKKSCLTIYGWTAYDKTIPLNKLSKIVEIAKVDWKEVESNIISIKAGQHGGEISPIFPIILDRNMGSIIGHVLGDGSIDSKYHQLFFSNSDKALLMEFAKNMNHIFRVKPRVWMQKTPDFGNTQWDKKIDNIDELKEGRNAGLFYPTICGRILNSIFNNFAVGKNKRITEEIINSKAEFKSALIRAFFDDEATVDKQRRYIRVFQDRPDILEIFRVFLLEFNIQAQPLKYYVKREKKRYYFDIYKSKSNLLKFEQEIGFTSPVKAMKLRTIIHQV